MRQRLLPQLMEEFALKRIILIVTLLAFSPPVVMAHSGGTDRQGCHVNHKTGIRHCH
jgi:hypothetical protein